MSYLDLFRSILEHYSETEEYSRYAALNLETYDICLDNTYPGYSDGILALRNISMDTRAYTAYDLYVNINFLTHKEYLIYLLNKGITYVNRIYIVDYAGYDKSINYFMENWNYEFVGEAPANLQVQYISPLLPNALPLLYNMDEKKIHLIPSRLSRIGLHFDIGCDLKYIVKLLFDLFFDIHRLDSNRYVNISISLPDIENVDEMFNVFISELILKYNSYSTLEKSYLTGGLTIVFVFLLYNLDGGSSLRFYNKVESSCSLLYLISRYKKGQN
jgi:hypothetical protein